jgi:hypothetical protein
MSEWSEWIEHDGKRCPLPAGTPVHVVEARRPGVVEAYGVCTNPPDGGSWCWANNKRGRFIRYTRVLRYRYRKPAGLLLLEQIAADPLDMVPA